MAQIPVLVISMVSLLILSPGAAGILSQVPVIEKETGLLLGYKDELDKSDMRMIVNYTSNPIELKSYQYAIVDLGLSEWGPIQTSLIMKEYPIGYGHKTLEAFCSVSEEMVTYNLRSQVDISAGSFIYDHVIRANEVFILTSKFELVQIEILTTFYITPAEVSFLTEKSKLNTTWTCPELDLKAKKLSGKTPTQYLMALHTSLNTMFIVTDIGIFTLHVIERELVFAGNPGNRLKGTLTYVTIKEDILFVGVRDKGIYIYDITKRDTPTYLGVIGASQFGKPESEAINLSSFDVDDYQLEIIYSGNQTLSDQVQKTNPDENAFFKNFFSIRDRTDVIRSSVYTDFFLFAAEKTGIFVFNITELIKYKTNPPKSPLPTIIPIQNVRMITRFHNMLYALSDSENGLSQVTEVFLYGKNLEKWDQTLVSPALLYSVNRVYTSLQTVSSIYVDENYLYMISEKSTKVLERGIHISNTAVEMQVGRNLAIPNLHAVSKAIIDGGQFLIAISNSTLSEIKISVSDPHLRCPPRIDHHSFDVFGKYVFEINATVKNCPLKLSKRTEFSDKTYMEMPCVLTTQFEIDYARTNLATGLRLVHFMIMGGLLFVMLVFCAVWNQKRLDRMNVEHEVLRQEIKHYKEKASFEVSQLKSADNQKYKLNRSTDSAGGGDKSIKVVNKSDEEEGKDQDFGGNSSKLEYPDDEAQDTSK